jgi:hypothetical protein
MSAPKRPMYIMGQLKTETELANRINHTYAHGGGLTHDPSSKADQRSRRNPHSSG